MLQPTVRVLLASVFCGALTACSSSGGSSASRGPSDSVSLVSPNISTRGYNEDEALFSEIDALDYTDPSSLPTESGYAQYNGIVGLKTFETQQVPRDVLSGELTMNVQFASPDPISGSVTNITNEANEQYRGRLDLGASEINRTADPGLSPTYWASLGGSVIDPQGEHWAIESTVLGDFYGSDHSHTAGEVYGGACSSLECVELGGSFAATQ